MDTEPLALTLATRRPRRAAIASASLVTFGIVAALGTTMVPVTLACAVAALTAVALIGVGACAEPLQRVFAENAAACARSSRREARARELEKASIRRDSLADLTRLVGEIEERDPRLVARYELEALLDRYVALTKAQAQAAHAVTLTDRLQLERDRERLLGDREADPRRAELCERRIACHRTCELRAHKLADELAIIEELVRLIAQRAAMPEEPPADDTIDRELAELDAQEAARRQLAAEIR